jgi:GlpG protein
VVYALAGYVWMRGKHDPNADVYLDPQSMQWLLIWLVLCFTGLLGPVANTAHVVGLVAGAVWGRLAAWRAWRR